MQLAHSQSTPPPRPAFAAILRPDANVVSIPRPIDPSLRTQLAQLAQRSEFRHEARLDTITTDVRDLLVSIDNEAARAFLAEDIRDLAQQFGAVLGRRHLHAELSIQRSDACRKIHTDYVSIRLLCTYAGPGTDWLPNRDFVRRHLGRADVDVETANRLMVREGAELRRCAAGEVLLLKGESYPGNEGRGAAHRSPPLGTSGVARLVLKIDEHRCGC